MRMIEYYLDLYFCSEVIWGPSGQALGTWLDAPGLETTSFAYVPKINITKNTSRIFLKFCPLQISDKKLITDRPIMDGSILKVFRAHSHESNHTIIASLIMNMNKI